VRVDFEGAIVPDTANFSFPWARLGMPAAAVAAGLLMAGCAARPPAPPVPKYVAPTSGPTAKLVMRAAVPAGDIYGVIVHEDSEKCAGPRIVGTGDAKRNPVTTALAANQVQTVEFRLIKPSRQTCAVRWSFTPVAGKSYLVRGVSTPTGCLAVVMDMTDPEKIKPEPTALRRNPVGSACLPIAQSKSIGTTGADGTQAGQGQDAVLRQGAGAEDLQGLIGQ
jgi:hypothetical protein